MGFHPFEMGGIDFGTREEVEMEVMCLSEQIVVQIAQTDFIFGEHKLKHEIFLLPISPPLVVQLPGEQKR